MTSGPLTTAAVAAPAVARGPGGLSSKTKESIAGYVFMAPFLIGLFGLSLVPIIASSLLSFTDYNLLTAPTWVGLDNYRALLADGHYRKSLVVTFVFVGLSVPTTLLAALVLAAVLNRGIRGLAIYRAVFYVPSLLGGSVAIAVLWRQLFADGGVVNRLLGFFGWEHPPAWLVDPDFTLQTLVILSVWQFGAPMIIFLAGLRQIPADLYEAARVDGAGRLAQFFRITIPLLTPLVLFNLIMQMIGAFQAFTSAYVISGGKGGPLDSTLFYTLYLYIQGFGYLHMGYASAMAWVLLVIIGAFTALIFATSRHWVFYMEQQ
jgi:multiple sugar transport system permease protein